MIPTKEFTMAKIKKYNKTEDRNKRHYKKEILEIFFPSIGKINDSTLDEISDRLEIAPEDVSDENLIIYKIKGKVYEWVDGPNARSHRNPYFFVRLEETKGEMLSRDGYPKEVTVSSRSKALKKYLPALVKDNERRLNSARLLSGDKNLSGLDFRGRKFISGVDLTGVNLTNAELIGVELKVADFTGANFNRAYIVKSDLRDSTFKGADFNRTMLVDSDLRGSDFSGLTLVGIDFINSDLRGADFRGSDLSNLRPYNLDGVRLEGAKMEGSIVSHWMTNVPKLDLSKAIILDRP